MMDRGHSSDHTEYGRQAPSVRRRQATCSRISTAAPSRILSACGAKGALDAASQVAAELDSAEGTHGSSALCNSSDCLGHARSFTGAIQWKWLNKSLTCGPTSAAPTYGIRFVFRVRCQCQESCLIGAAQ